MAIQYKKLGVMEVLQKDLKAFHLYSYSSPSLNYFKKVIEDVLELMGKEEKVEDVVAYGLFLKPCEYFKQDYAEFGWDKIPGDLVNGSYMDKEAYVLKFIENLLLNNEEKPEWMLYAEDHPDAFGIEKPNYLIAVPRDIEYKKLIQDLLQFLYFSVKTNVEVNPSYFQGIMRNQFS